MFIVGIAGGSGSGKTTFTQKILNYVGDARVGVFHQDSYYCATHPSHLKVHGEPNFDHPEAFDWELMTTHLAALRRGEAIDVPTYDYVNSRRQAVTQTLGPCEVILVEGIFTLWKPEMRALYDLKVFLNVEADIRFIRRLYRDVRERGRTLDGIIRQYYDCVRPMHHEFLEPTRAYADLIVGEETDLAAQVIAARVSQALLKAPGKELDV